MKKHGRRGKPHSVKFVDIVRASKQQMKRVLSKSRDSKRSYEMNLDLFCSQSVVNEIHDSSSFLPPLAHSRSHSQHASFQHTSDKNLGHSSIKSLERRGNNSLMYKSSTFSKLRSKNVIRKSKRPTMRKHGIKDTVYMVDHISNLPDCILHQILSFIPTKEAVKTSVLSPRWKNLWVSVPNLDVDAREIDDWNAPKLTSLMNFLERVLHSRSESNIKKFCLSCSGRNEESQVHSWISDAINHNLQELDLHFIVDGQFMIPWSILNTTSLVSLKITTTWFEQLPFCFSLPCLKVLHLKMTVFPDVGKVEKLLLGCPVLEELVLVDNWMDSMNIVISNSTLKSLTICDMRTFGAYFVAALGCKMKIDGPNLTYFKYSGYLTNEIIWNNTSSLVKACINILPHHPRWKELVATRAVDLLKPMQFVVSLSVSETAIQACMLLDRKLDRVLMFENLKHLELLTSEKLGNKTFGAVMDFLHCCPVLQSIRLSQGFEQCKDLGASDSTWSPLPKCISNSLKTVTLKDLCGNKLQMCFLKHILKHACVLERLEIWWSETCVGDLKKKTKVTKKLEQFERSSTACVINFLL